MGQVSPTPSHLIAASRAAALLLLLEWLPEALRPPPLTPLLGDD